MASAARGARRLPLRSFFLDYRKTALEPDELVTCIRVPANPQSRWYKIGKRGAVNISVVCCAVSRNPGGRIGLAFGCAGPTPMFARNAESILTDGRLDEKTIDAAAKAVEQEVSPIDDHRGSAAYRRAMCATLTRRLLTDLAAGDGKGDADA